jgi:hypothetical protein
VRSLALDADKVGDCTIKDLVALAEVQGCELHIQFTKRPDQAAKEAQAQKAAAAVGPALRKDR